MLFMYYTVYKMEYILEKKRLIRCAYAKKYRDNNKVKLAEARKEKQKKLATSQIVPIEGP